MAISHPNLIRFFNEARRKSFSAGEIITRGEEPSGVVCIQSGTVRVYSISDEGNRYIHVLYKAGELFPLIWALKGIRRRIFYEAASDVVVSEADRAEFIRFIKTDSEVTFDVLCQLAQQFYIFADSLDNLQYKSAHERVAYRLVFLAGRFGRPEGGKIIIEAPLTHALISESINLSRETVSREIEKLEKRRVIGREKGYIIIEDINKLSQEFSEPVTLDLWGLNTKKT